MKAKILAMLLVVTIILSGTAVNAMADSCPRGGPHYGSAHYYDVYQYEDLGTHMHITAYANGEAVYEECRRTAVYQFVKDICVKCNGEIARRWVLKEIDHRLVNS